MDCFASLAMTGLAGAAGVLAEAEADAAAQRVADLKSKFLDAIRAVKLPKPYDFVVKTTNGVGAAMEIPVVAYEGCPFGLRASGRKCQITGGSRHRQRLCRPIRA